MKPFILSTAKQYEIAPNAVTRVDVRAGLYVFRTSGEPLIVTQTGTLADVVDAQPGFLLDDRPILVVCGTGQLQLLSQNGGFVWFYIAEALR